MSRLLRPTIRSFDPITQNITFLAADGTTPISISIASIDAWHTLIITSSISYAAQTGASFLMLIVVVLLTQPAKRRTPLFLLNTLSLLLAGIANALVLSYYASPATHFWTWFSLDDSLVPPTTLATTIAANTLSPLFLGALEASLFLQTRAIVGTMRALAKWTTVGIGLAVAALAVAFNFTQMVMNNVGARDFTYYDNPNWYWVPRAVNISYCLSIWYFCCVFVVKLLMTMYTRREMGMRQWGPMRIICIMSGCTMVIPSIFSLLEFHGAEFPWVPSAISHTLVAIMLPLSSIWASASIEGNISASDALSRRHHFFATPSRGGTSGDRCAGSTSKGSVHSRMPLNTLSSRGTLVNDISFAPKNVDVEVGGSRDGGVKGRGPAGGGGWGGNEGLQRETGAAENRVMVEKSYSVRSSRALDGLMGKCED